ncbi:MAG: hypothetical protein K2J38_03600 [Muribaculaceae bacterium]|nr:hypothetical protein [Muribaculaceae bacterium]
MSKTSLKKELMTFTSEQLVEVIMNAYGSSKEARDYFEFFLNPDPEQLLEKKLAILDKEMRRTKWGMSKARISIIRGLVKDFASYGVSAEHVLTLMLRIINTLITEYRYINYPETLLKGTQRLVRDCIEYAAANDLLSAALEQLNTMIRADIGTPNFRRTVAQVMTDAIEELGARLK